MFKAGILVSNYPIPWHQYNKDQDVPVFSVHGRKDVITMRQFSKLEKRYSQNHHESWVHDKGHMIPKNGDAINRYLEFIQKHIS